MSPQPNSDRDPEHSPLNTRALTWAALLGKWTEFAKSALALPDDVEGQLLRQSVPDIITLQAVWFALQHLDELDASERALGLDRAEILIDKHTASLRHHWSNQLPNQLKELIAEVKRQFAVAATE